MAGNTRVPIPPFFLYVVDATLGWESPRAAAYWIDLLANANARFCFGSPGRRYMEEGNGPGCLV